MLHKLKNKPKIERLLIACLLLVGIAVSTAAPAVAVSVSDFTDVSAGAWYYDAVSYVAGKGLFAGTSSTTFTPNGTMTRGMFVTVLGRYAGVDPLAWCAGTVTGSSVNMRSAASTSASVVTVLSKGASVTLTGQSGSWYQVKYGSKTGYVAKEYVSPKYHQFSDVDYGAYYAGYVIWGYENGIVNGMSSTSFSPNSNVTREQICKLLAGYASYAGITLKTTSAAVTFTDQSSISSWAASGVTAMQRAGVVIGEAYGSGYRFRPKSSATRAEAAAIFQRFAGAGTSSSTTPTPTPTGGTSPAADTPATFLSAKIAVPAETVRVGILANTRTHSYAVSSVKLENTSGSSFEYGTFGSDRTFSKAGTISSASITVTANGSTFTVKNASGSVVYTGAGNLAIRPVASSGKALTRVNSGNRYFGDFELRQAYNAAGYITVINYVNVEDYVKGVLPYEFSPTWPAETLKAAAIAARNIVMTATWSTYSSFGFDIMSNDGTQTYRGRGEAYAESYFAGSDAAADATKGVYLTYSSGGANKLCITTYFSTDGGATEDAAHIWGTAYSYLIGKIDPYEAPVTSLASNYTKTVTLSRTSSQLTGLAANAGLGSTTIAQNGIQIETYPATGNVKSILLTGSNGKTATISQSTSFTRWNFLAAVGITAYSYRFTVTYNAAADTFTITRYGWGHNVGMSSWGAYAMAKNYNKTYQDILGFYYTGTHLQYGAY